LVLRLMEAGVEVRILLWYPQVATEFIVGAAHMEDHLYTARAVQAWNEKLVRDKFPNAKRPIGVVALDLRVCELAPPRGAAGATSATPSEDDGRPSR
jgi:hypothetical protein